MTNDTECKKCGYQFNFDISKEINLCPGCGSKEIIRQIFVEEKVTFHESLKGKVKDKKYSSKKNPRKEFFTGDEMRKADGKWMKKERVVDKNSNLYKETVVDSETGTIVHHCEEPLDQHIGHGSAKKK